jgi:hypothetical protein
MEYLFACFSRILIEIAVGVTYEQHRGGKTVDFIGRSPSKSVYWPSFLGASINLPNFIISSQVEYANKAVTIPASCQCVFIIESSHHQFRFIGYRGFHENFVLKRDLLDYPE